MTERQPTDNAPQQQSAVPPSTVPTPFPSRPWLLALALVVVTFVVYQPVWHAGFIWDDDQYFTENPAMVSVDGLKQIWSSLLVSRFVPLTLTSFWVERRLWGLDPLPYHAVNIALQAVNAVLLWGLLRRLKVRGAWVAAAVWAVHLVNAETVAWVTELKNTQSGLFFLVALLAFLRFEDGLRSRDYVVALACGAAAMLSKSSTVVLPGVILTCAWWRRGRWTRQDFLRVAPLVAFGVGMSLWTIVEQRSEIAYEPASEWTLTAAQRLLIAGRAAWFYAGKALWPAGVCFVYPRWELRVHSAVAWLPLAGLALVAGTLWKFRRSGWARAATFGLGYFIIALLPVLGFFDTYFFRYSFVADHFQYLASIGPIALAVSASAVICQRAGVRGRYLGALGTAAVLLMLGVSTWRQSHIYRDVETLWRDTLAKNPDAYLAHNNLGTVLQRAGKVQEAIGHFEQVLRIKPDDAGAQDNWGNALQQAGKVQEAIGHYQEALRIKPDHAGAHNNWGNALQQAGKLQEAIGHYQQALRIDPDFAEAHNNLGSTLAALGNVQEAIKEYEHALRLKPDFTEAYNNLGNALLGLGKAGEAIGQYEQALRIKPDSAEAHCNLGDALFRLGKVQEAIGHYEQALRIRPKYAHAHVGLGDALSLAGKLPEAIGQYEQALRIKPDDAGAHNNWGNALRQAGKLQEAIGHYQEALRIKPDFAEAHNNLGSTLAALGNVQEAVKEYEHALRLKPDFAEAHNNLGNTLLGLGKAGEAIGQYEQALRIKPDSAEAHCNLGDALFRLGKVPEAIGHYEQALRIRPEYAHAHVGLGDALSQAGKFPEAIGHYEQALRIKTDYAVAQNNLAWLLATVAPTEGRDLVRAVALAQRACELTGNRVPNYIDTLAVAYAAAGRFSEAVAAAQKGIDLARAAGQTQLAEKMEARLELYRRGQAYK